MTELKREINNSAIIIRDLNTLLIMGTTVRQKISGEREDLKNIINQLKVLDLYRTFYPTAAEYSS